MDYDYSGKTPGRLALQRDRFLIHTQSEETRAPPDLSDPQLLFEFLQRIFNAVLQQRLIDSLIQVV